MLTLIFAVAGRLVARGVRVIAARLSHFPAVSLHSGRAIAISGKTAIQGVGRGVFLGAALQDQPLGRGRKARFRQACYILLFGGTTA